MKILVIKMYYNVLTRTFFDCANPNPHALPTNIFCNGYSQIELGSSAKIRDIYQALISSSGDIMGLDLPSGGEHWNAGIANDNAIVYESYDVKGSDFDPVRVLGYYNIEQGVFVPMNQYIDKLYDDLIDIGKLYFSEERIVIPLLGEDNYVYVAIFDKQWNEILPPTKVAGEEYLNAYSCNRLVTNFGGL